MGDMERKNVLVVFMIFTIASFGLSSNTAYAVGEFAVAIQKDCDDLVVQVPDNPADPINCTITVANIGTETLTNCIVSDGLIGLLALPSTLTPGQVAAIATQIAVTAQMIIDMTIINDANVLCDGADVKDVFASDEASIEVRSVDGDVQKTCMPDAQFEPGIIDWDWTVTNTSPDGKSALDVSCDGFSTLNDPEVEDNLLTALLFGGTATNMWVESGLAAGTYENEITCTFTAEDTRSFQRTASDMCEVTPDVPVGGTFVPIDQSALLLAGAQSVSMWMIPVILAGVGIGVFVIKRRK